MSVRWIGVVVGLCAACNAAEEPRAGTPASGAPSAPAAPASTRPPEPATCAGALKAAFGEPTAGWTFVATDGPALTPAQREAVSRAALADGRPPLTIDYPRDESVFPPEIPAPAFLWHDETPGVDAWLVDVALDGGAARIRVLARGAPPPRGRLDPSVVTPGNTYKLTDYQVAAKSWRPDAAVWDAIKACSVRAPATVTFAGLRKTALDAPLSAGRVRLATSTDPVGAPVFFRAVPLPFKFALKNLERIRWELGDVSSAEPPHVVMENIPVCANCHSFSADGRRLALDVDYASDKGSYAIADLQPEIVLDKAKVMTWNSYQPGDGVPTFGLLSQISPDGRHVISTVKDISVFVPMPEMLYSQLFFPIRGVLVAYDVEAKTFTALDGARDPAFVQSNPAWSPDGQTVVFARATAVDVQKTMDKALPVLRREDLPKVLGAEAKLQYDRFGMLVTGGKRFRFDLYRVPFAGGHGGAAEKLPGASENGRSNFFPKFSPDGRWIVFCQADSFMLLRHDSELYILPAEGGTPRRMRANMPGKMNSWHSFSPNGRWLVFSSKANGPYTQLWLTHIDEAGNDTPAVLLEHFTAANRAANIPEFVNLPPGQKFSVTEAFADAHSYFRQGFQYWELADYALAATQFEKALHLEPTHAESHKYLGNALLKLGRAAEAIAHYRAALEGAPDDAETQRMLAEALHGEGRAAEAIARLEKLLARQAGDVKARRQLGRQLLEGGQAAAAAAHLAKAAAQTPDDANLRALLATALERQGLRARAVAELERAIAVDPKHHHANDQLARLLATSPEDALRDGPRAVDLAEKTCKANSFRVWQQLDTLAAAYAEAGRFEDAVRTAQDALRLVRTTENGDVASVEAHLARFQQGQPLRVE